MESSHFAGLLQKCVSAKCLRKARQLHALLTTAGGTPPSPFVANNILSLYVRCGSIEDARRVFEKMPQRNSVSYNALIAAYSRSPHLADVALELLPAMGAENLRPNGPTFTSLLQACSSLEDEARGAEMHTQVIKTGFLNDPHVQTSLLGMYCSCGDLESANQVFGEMDDKDAVAWNSIIYGNVKHNRVQYGLQLFSAMLRAGKMPTQFTFSIVLNACSRWGDGCSGEVVHALVIKSDVLVDAPLQNALLDVYSSAGDMATAFAVFKMIEEPDLVSWNSTLAGYSENGHGREAIELFILLLRTSKEKPDEYTFAATISATAAFPAVTYGKPLHVLVLKAGCEGSVYVSNTLVNMYFRNDEIESSRKLFDSVLHKDAILWTEMISGHLKLGEGEKALKYFCEMEREHEVDNYAFSSALSSAADLAALKQGEMIHAQVVKCGYEADLCVSGSLVDMYCKNGKLEAASIVFSESKNRDLKCWNAMLGGFSHHGKAEDAFQFFDEMVEKGFTPDRVTFVSLLSACSHCGLVEQGKYYWNYMLDIGLLPGIKHYSCMVCLLSRAGFLQEAEDLIIKSTMEKFPELWRILLGSCVVHRDPAVGVRAAERVLYLLDDDIATHILLSNLYAATGKWEAVAEMRRKMRRLTTDKDPGLSWTELFDEIHVFSAGYESHPRVHIAQAELQRLIGNMDGCKITDSLTD